MDIDHNRGRVPRSSPTKPLQIRKQLSQIRVARSQQKLNNNQSKPSSNSGYPPRTSSLHRCNDPDASGMANRDEKTHSRQKSENSSNFRPTISRGEHTSVSDRSIGGSPSATRSTIPSCKAHYLSGSSEIIGNFVPVDTRNMAISTPHAGSERVFPNVTSGLCKPNRIMNPYEFEPETPYVDNARQPIISNCLDNKKSGPSVNPRRSHLKNSLSEGNAMCMTQPLVPLNISPSRPSSRIVQRNERSPHFTPFRSPDRHDRPLSPDVLAYCAQDERPDFSHRRGRSPSRSEAGCSHQYLDAKTLGKTTTYCRTAQDSSMGQDWGSPTRLLCQSSASMSPPKVSSPNRYLTRSTAKGLDNVSESDEYDDRYADPFFCKTPSSPKKRSRSPMKKMFGEHGWLGRSPDEVQTGNSSSKRSPLGRKEKSSVMGKLRTKIEEFAEKADLSPISRGPRSQGKHPKLSVLSISLGPPEQARIYMEVELMIVHTANSFLMSQFSQGRMAVDSIKKTVDTWKARGRPLVIEFMYDQATQRDLIAVNQHNLRFYGETAGDSVRINTMLYNWRQVTSLMAIRTFCDADTVILKLLFDIEQILELLGARQPILLRLQQIRASANEMMRFARQKAQRNIDHREPTCNSQSSTGSSSKSQSIDDPYGGLRLVPEFYME